MCMTMWAFTLTGYFIQYILTSGNITVLAVTLGISAIIFFIHLKLSKHFPAKQYIFPGVTLLFSIATVITVSNIVLPKLFNYELPLWNSLIEADLAPQFLIGIAWILIPVLLIQLGQVNKLTRTYTFSGFLLVILWILVIKILLGVDKETLYSTRIYNYLLEHNFIQPVFRFIFGLPLFYWLALLFKFSEIKKILYKS